MHTIIPILHPFAEATEILGKEDLPTGSSIYPLLTDMMEDLKTTEEDKALAKQLKKTISMGLVKRFKFLSEDGGIINEGLNSSLLKASALDPRYKSLKFLTESQRKELHANIAEEIRRSSNTAEVKKEPEADEVTEPP
ncbi:E3 SUMO-protein ligase ZBED1-like, partial [Tachypleus tridentatus]|uniref:E3 SUMO-protein ligase ZBED1-like n=1 Tax=Tachypleus tridentatus TaxID=6853 RepID=UPI003FCFD704